MDDEFINLDIVLSDGVSIDLDVEISTHTIYVHQETPQKRHLGWIKPLFNNEFEAIWNVEGCRESAKFDSFNDALTHLFEADG